MSEPSGGRALAIVVEKPDTGAAIDALRAIDRYDATRSVRERDDETTEIPITDDGEDGPSVAGDIEACPDWLAERDVIEQPDPVTRGDGLRARLRDRGFTAEELERVPASWAVVGDVVLIRLPEDCPRPSAVGEALLELHGADTVLNRGGIEGPHREPDVAVVAGSGATETVHTEHGTKYALDLAEVMFAPGNKAERVRMGEVVEPDERIFDLFAGVGYFALPMARAGAHVTAIERNPAAFRYLVENGALNDVTERLSPIRGDTAEVLPELLAADVPPADRIVMGHYDALDYLDVAVPAVAPGGTLHVHAAVAEPELWGAPLDRLERGVARADRTIETVEKRRVKTHAAGVTHVVLDARIGER